MTAIKSGFKGIHAATLCPMKEDFSIDKPALERHLGKVSSVDGINGLLLNGHAGENFMLERSEMKSVISLARSIVQKDCFLTSGVISENSLEAALQAREAEEAGVDAILVFPPFSWALSQDLDAILNHHRIISEACSLPIVLYGAPVTSGKMAYQDDTLKHLLDIPQVSAIKEGSWEVAHFEKNYRLCRSLRPDVAVLGSGDEHLLTSYMIGGDGSQVSLAAIVPEQIVALWRAASSGQWQEARRWHEQLYHLSISIYRAVPGSRANARLKHCLSLLDSDMQPFIRPPQSVLDVREIENLKSALETACISLVDL